MSEEKKRESYGRIEVAPEVLATIAHLAVSRTEGVLDMASVPADAARLFRRSPKHDGVLLDMTGNKIKFDIYVIMSPHVNIMETSETLQTAVVDAINNMVGVPVDTVNIHVEDVNYAQGEAV